MPEPSPALKLACTVVRNEPVAPGVQLMRLMCPELARAIEPGQFFNLDVPGDPTQLLRLPFSWSDRDVEAGEVEFAFHVVGDGTRRLAQLAVGTQTDLLGPAGHGWRVPDGLGRALLVAQGKGAVSLMALMRSLAAKGVDCDAAWGAVSSDQVLFESDIASCGATLHVATDDGSRGAAGSVADVAADLLAHNAYDAVFACASDTVMARVAAAAREASVPCQVSMERLMACGFGACTTCLVDTVNGRKGACKDGPVFDAEEVIW